MKSKSNRYSFLKHIGVSRTAAAFFTADILNKKEEEKPVKNNGNYFEPASGKYNDVYSMGYKNAS